MIEQIEAMAERFYADSGHEPTDLLNAIGNAAACGAAARRDDMDPAACRAHLERCAAWAIAAIREIGEPPRPRPGAPCACGMPAGACDRHPRGRANTYPHAEAL